LRAIRPDDLWCDDPHDRRYNRHVRGQLAASHEKLLREDAVYDLVLTLDHNRRPPIAGHGSAIFLHIARDGFPPTEGCVALRRADLIRLVRRLESGDRLRVR
jgi:L,D-peptidoglycan transpeptidase YkuD (ErfK/YbiS/YcfS/YnhG family)